MDMEKLQSLADNAAAIAKVIGLIALLLFVLLCAFTWLMWALRKGRWLHGHGDTMSVFGELMLNVLNDFRHLLALGIMLLVGVAALAGAVLADSLIELGEFVRDVMSYVGGLVGAIIGYYFGERAGAHSPSAGIRSHELEQSDKIIEADLPDRAGRET